MPHLLLAEGGKPRPGELLLLAVFFPAAALSTRGLPPTLLLLSPATSGSSHAQILSFSLHRIRSAAREFAPPAPTTLGPTGLPPGCALHWPAVTAHSVTSVERSTQKHILGADKDRSF